MLEWFYQRPGDPDVAAAFRTRGFVHDWSLRAREGEGLAMAALPPILRMLLVTDGTVTKCLESYFWEPVQVCEVVQRVERTSAALDLLELAAGAEVLTRSVRLIGSRSACIYASAFSVIRLDLLPLALRQDLLQGLLGIGELLRECGLETYRELVEIGRAPMLAADDTVFRAYRIHLDHQPAMLVSETFPIAVYQKAPALSPSNEVLPG